MSSKKKAGKQRVFDAEKRHRSENHHPQFSIPDAPTFAPPPFQLTAAPQPSPTLQLSKKQDDEDGGWGFMDWVHTGLDLVGLVPGFGEAADLINAGIYAIEGDYENAALSAASAIPLAGYGATAAKWGKKGLNAVDGMNDARKGADNIALYAKYQKDLKLQSKYGSKKVLPDGRNRYYVKIKEASTPGEMQGMRKVREWNPKTDASRTWFETLDQNGKIRQVRPEFNKGMKQQLGKGNEKFHYRFDSKGDYIGTKEGITRQNVLNRRK